MLNEKNYVSIKDYQENDNLPGAVSTESEFFCADKDDVTIVPMREHVPDNYGEDVENKLFVDLNGAVANAFDLKFLPEKERPDAIREILMEYKLKYPEYDFEMKQGQFPVKVDLGMKFESGYRMRNHSTMSTHVLYIKNYGSFVKSPKLFIRRRGYNNDK